MLGNSSSEKLDFLPTVQCALKMKFLGWVRLKSEKAEKLKVE